MKIIARECSTRKATIANGATASGAIECADYVLGTVFIPSTFDGTTLTFQNSPDGSTFVAAHKQDSDAAWSLTVTASKSYPIPPEVLCAHSIKIVAGTAQTGDSELTVVLKA